METPQSQSLKLVAAVFWCHTVAPDDTQYQPQPWTGLPGQEEILNQSPRLELADPGNRLVPFEEKRCGLVNQQFPVLKSHKSFRIITHLEPYSIACLGEVSA